MLLNLLVMKNLNVFKSIVLIVIAFVLLSFIDIPDHINTALKSGDTAALKKYMNSTVELVILDKENIYSKIQAEQVLKQFFNKHKPLVFHVLHHGSNDNSQYYIGSLKTEKETYRIYYLLKTKDKQTLIYQLRIESDE